MSRTAQLVVLCGGPGTRMASVTTGQKCLVPVAGRPFLGHVLDAAARPPVDRVLLLAGHRGDEVAAFAQAWGDGNKRAGDHLVAIRAVAEQEPLGPIGALRGSAALLDREFLLVLGDVLPPPGRDLWTELADVAHETGAAGVMAVAPAAASQDQGNAEISGPWVTRYDKDVPGPYIDRAIRFLSKSALDWQPGAHDAEFFGGLAACGRLAHVLIGDPVIEVGTPDRWMSACALLEARAPAGAPHRAALS